MLLSIKTKLKLNQEQKTLFSKHAGIARFTYNWGLATWNDFDKSGLKPNKFVLKKFFNKYVKPEYLWIKEKGICQKITQYAFDSLGNAFGRYVQKLGEKPKFKQKGQHDSFTIDAGGKPLVVGGTSIKLPTIGWVKTYEALPTLVTTKFTISRIADDWFIAFAYEQKFEVKPKPIEIVGVDLGINSLAMLSTGVCFPGLKQYRKTLAKLQRLSQQHSRKVKGSNNRYKSKIKLAKFHARVANVRQDYLHKITNYLCKNHATIVIENLNVSGLLKNHNLARAISDLGLYEFQRQLLYKAEKFGNEIIVADRFYPSSQLCSNCGSKQKMLLSERVYKCNNCNYQVDRDLNASLNLASLAKACKLTEG